MKQITNEQMADLTSRVRNMRQVALVLSETALEMTRTPDGAWRLDPRSGERLCHFALMLEEDTGAAERQVLTIASEL
jgi:hypothetical protein